MIHLSSQLTSNYSCAKPEARSQASTVTDWQTIAGGALSRRRGPWCLPVDPAAPDRHTGTRRLRLTRNLKFKFRVRRRLGVTVTPGKFQETVTSDHHTTTLA